MSWLITKYLITAAVVVVVSELARRSDKLGALIAALPIVTILVMIWLYVENQPMEKIANHAWYTFWYVVPTLPMFLIFPTLLHLFGFWPSLVMNTRDNNCVFLAFFAFPQAFWNHSVTLVRSRFAVLHTY